MDRVTTAMIVSATYGQFVFDAVFSTDHTTSLTLTQHPVQSGAAISDHAYIEPDEVSLEIGMSDTVADAAGVGEHSVNAYARLREIMQAREPLTLITRLRTYPNMVITSISAPDDYKTMHALRANVYLQQVNVVAVSTMSIQQTVSGSKTAASSTPATPPATTKSSGSSSSSKKKPSSSSHSSSSSSTKKVSVLKQAANALKTSTTVKSNKTTSKPSAAIASKVAGKVRPALK